MTTAIAVGVLVAAGVYLLMQRGLVRVAIGFVLLGHAVNLLLIATGVLRVRGAPLLGQGEVAQMADPLPQAFVLTAIVITFGLTVYLLALARAGGDDDPAADQPGGDLLDPEAPDEPGQPDEFDQPGAPDPLHDRGERGRSPESATLGGPHREAR